MIPVVQIFLYGRAKLINLMKNNEAQFEHKKVQFPGCKRLVIKSDESTVCLFYVWVFLKIEQFFMDDGCCHDRVYIIFARLFFFCDRFLL